MLNKIEVSERRNIEARSGARNRGNTQTQPTPSVSRVTPRLLFADSPGFVRALENPDDSAKGNRSSTRSGLC